MWYLFLNLSLSPSAYSKELSLKHIQKIEIVEEIFRTLEIGTVS